MTRLEQLPALFADTFGAAPQVIARAPGRVNLIGEHTDYNDGFVLPAAISVETRVAVRARNDDVVQVVALDLDGVEARWRIGDAPPAPGGGNWWSHVHGMMAIMQAEGVSLSGLDVMLTGTVPQGSGLSSSASLALALGTALSSLTSAALDPARIAQMAQRSEIEVVGTKCGIMDQLVSARGVADHALLIDCRSLDCRAVPLPVEMAIMIVHSGIVRGLVEGAYNQRRAACEAVAAALGVKALRDADMAMLDAARGRLDHIAYARARHVVSENARTLAAADALAAGDLVALGRLMADSHASMRDDFAITLPAIDALVALLQGAIGEQGGARMTGGGFGGAVVALMPQHRVTAVRAAVEAGYRTPAGSPPMVMIERGCAGAAVLS